MPQDHPDPEVVLRLVRSDADLAEALRIREAVFVREQGIPRTLDLDGLDDTSEHVLATLEAVVVGTGRLTISPSAPSTAVLARIALQPSVRGRGIGKRIVAELERIARQRGCDTATMSAHAKLVRYYEDLGYQDTGSRTHAGKHLLAVLHKLL